jgi:hypothetical protein
MPSTLNIANYADAGFPAVAIATADEDRSIAHCLSQLNRPNAWRIAASGGLLDARTGRAVDEKGNYTTALLKMRTLKQNEAPQCVLFMLDYQHVIRNAAAYRALRDTMTTCKALGAMIVLVSPAWQLPAELEHDIPVVNDALPSREELNASLTICANGAGAVVDDATRTAILDAASGLTLGEAEGAIALSFNGTSFDPGLVTEEKMKLVRQSGYLEVSAPANIADLGGLGGFRSYIEQEVVPVLHEPDLRVRGVLLVGIPGTGKSLAARVMSAMLNRPILRCDIGSLQGSLVGESERKMAAMFKLAEAVAPITLWFDELEKAVGGYASSANTDGGVKLGMVGMLLTFLQEHRSDIIVVATVNDYQKLPAELTRAGRFDERFFVNLPSWAERVEIAAVHLRKYGIAGGTCAERAADLSSEWTGAEIEQLVRSAARRTRRAITPEALEACAPDIRPISKVRGPEIAALREWGTANLRLANTVEATQPVASGRKIGARVAKAS